MTQLSNLFFKYLAWEFLKKFLLFSGILIIIVYMFDTIELIRRASGDDIGLGVLLQMALYKLPDVGQQILPFITLFAAIATFYNLTQRRELVCIRSAGLSVWQFIIPIITSVLAIGLLFITILHPLSAAAMTRYESLDNYYFGDGVKIVTVIDEGLWLRQEDATGSFIVRAGQLNAQTWVMTDVSVFFFGTDKKHLQRIDAKKAELRPNEWMFRDVSVYQDGEPPRMLSALALATNLTAQTITESFSNPQTISFWRLPNFISAVEKTGIDTTEIIAYYQTLLSLPLMLCAMVFMAAAIALKSSRTSGLLYIIIGGIGFGFVAFFLSGFLKALSLGHEIPILLGVWTVPSLVILTSITFLAQMEDG